MKPLKKYIEDDIVKGIHKGSRDAEYEMKGPGFHSMHTVFKDKSKYDRNEKHKKKICAESKK